MVSLQREESSWSWKQIIDHLKLFTNKQQPLTLMYLLPVYWRYRCYEPWMTRHYGIDLERFRCEAVDKDEHQCQWHDCEHDKERDEVVHDGQDSFCHNHKDELGSIVGESIQRKNVGSIEVGYVPDPEKPVGFGGSKHDPDCVQGCHCSICRSNCCHCLRHDLQNVNEIYILK